MRGRERQGGGEEGRRAEEKRSRREGRGGAGRGGNGEEEDWENKGSLFFYTTSSCSCMAGMSSLGSQSLWRQKLLSRSLDVCDVSIAMISHHHICNCEM